MHQHHILIPVHGMKEEEKVKCEQFPFKKVLQKLYMAVKFIFPLVEHGHMATVGCRRRKPEKLGGTLKIRGVLYLKVLGEYE